MEGVQFIPDSFSLNMGDALIESMRKVISMINKKRSSIVVEPKIGYSGKMDDFVTNLDREAQAIYVEMFERYFPDIGIIAEEDGFLKVPKQKDCYATIDGLDGTRAMISGQSYGIGTMISIVSNGQIVSAFVGDINTGKIYGFRSCDRVFSISNYGNSHLMFLNTYKSFKEGSLLCRRQSHRYFHINKLPKFNTHKIIGDSIGLWFANLWEGGFVAGILPPSFETPWDATPVFGISKKMGFIFMKIDSNTGEWKVYEPTLSTQTYYRNYDVLVIHENYITDFYNLL